MPNSEWYVALSKSELTPPAEIFRFVWPLLYLLMAVSFYLYLKNTQKMQQPLGIAFFCLQLFLNLLWYPVFFRLQHITGALLLLSLLIVTVGCTFSIFRKSTPPAAWLLTPYLLWLLFAWYLNFEIWRLNA